MRASANLRRLIEVNAPLWAGEQEVIGAYFRSPARSRDSDLLWLARQCRKEFWDSFDEDAPSLFVGPLKQLLASVERIDQGFSRHDALDLAETLYEEFSHYCAFADAYDAIRGPDDPAINPTMLRDVRSWPENEALAELRFAHRREHSEIGLRACHFTEGGYCSLFVEGMKLKGGSPADAAIAAACAHVYDDEFEHMLKGIAEIDEAGLDDAGWRMLERMTVAQMQARIHMRNGQFGNPLSRARVDELIAGKAPPVAFDYVKAGLAA